MKNRIIVLIGLVYLVFITSFLTQIVISNYGFIYDVNFGLCTTEDMEFFNKFIESKSVLSQTYYKEIDNQKLYDGALKGMFNAVEDPYTAYLDKKESENLYQSIEHEFDGIGVYLQENVVENTIDIVSVIPDTPAERAGILAEDRIIKINGIEYKGTQIDDAVKYIREKPGQVITITVLRGKETKEIQVKCEHIRLDTVTSQVVENIGYIQIAEFGDGTAKEFAEHYKDLREKNVKGLILDLRDNTGGVYEEVIEIAKMIVPEGLIVYTQDKNGKKEEIFSASEGIDMPLVVLINEYSASASEVLAGAIKDRECGILVGAKSYGKGVIQAVYNMPDGTSMKVTISKYYTPNGTCIDGVGIEPDKQVKGEQNQIEEAIKIIKEKTK